MTEQAWENFIRWLEEDEEAARRRKRRKQRRRRRIIRRYLAAVLAILAIVAALLAWKAHVRSKEGWSDLSLQEAVYRMNEDRWVVLDTDAQLDCLRSVAGALANELGIETVRLCAEELEPELLGQYSHKERKVTINVLHLQEKSAETILHTLAHEIYHAYQHALVTCYNDLDKEQQELALFQSARQYQQEFSSYIPGMEDPVAYAQQQCEKDCNAYADKVVQTYSPLFM